MLRQLCRALQGPPSASQLLTAARSFSAAAIEAGTEAEKAIAQKILAGLQQAESISVQDTSGGCGTMYQIQVVSPDFAGKSIVKQHQTVTKLLQDDIKQWHGFHLTTSAPEATKASSR